MSLFNYLFSHSFISSFVCLFKLLFIHYRESLAIFICLNMNTIDESGNAIGSCTKMLKSGDGSVVQILRVVLLFGMDTVFRLSV